MENVRFTKNQPLKSVKELFLVNEKLIKDQREITGLTTIDYKKPTWRSTTLSCDKAIEITNANTYVFADSVLCLGGISIEPVQAWENKIKWYLEARYLKELNRIDGEPMEFEWKISQDSQHWECLKRFTFFMTELHCELEQFKGRTILMSMYNDIVWREQGNTEKCVTSSRPAADNARKFLPGHWSFSGPGSDKKWYETYHDKWNREWEKTAEVLMLCVHSESCHPIFRATSAPGRGEFRSKGKGKDIFSLQR